MIGIGTPSNSATLVAGRLDGRSMRVNGAPPPVGCTLPGRPSRGAGTPYRAPMTQGPLKGDDGIPRCPWALQPAEYTQYHDEEWGRPVGDDQRIYEKLCLEGFQSGLSWLTILRKRENFRAAFSKFDPKKVAKFSDADV